ncbi:MAG TPA: DUF4215 domain-containing protein [bacterium]|nr:DUF4215 domain-containing protein [bacterium]
MKTNPSFAAAPCTTRKPSALLRRWKLKLLAGFFILGAAPAANAALINVDTVCQCGFPDSGGGSCATTSVSGVPVNCAGLGIAGDGDGFCSFGEAIMAAEQNQDVDGCSGANVSGPYDPLGDTVILPSGQNFIFTAPDNFDPDIGPNGLPVVRQLLLVEGSGSRLFRDPGADNDVFLRFFEVNGLLSVNKLTFENGNPGCDASYCGDGIVQGDNEDCDVKVCENSNTPCTSDDECDGSACISGNNNDGVGCSADCRHESCGDGVLDPGEQCDPTQTCALTGEDCSGGGFCPSVQVCFDPNGNATDTPCPFATSCEQIFGPGSFCDFTTQACESADPDCSGDCEHLINGSLCGNGIQNAGEGCDNGARCVSNIDGSIGADCTTSPISCGRTETCQPVAGDGCDEFCNLETCGNGVIDDGEQCDPGGICVNSDHNPYEPERPCTTDAECQAIGSPSDSCAPRTGGTRAGGGSCNECQLGAYGRCYDAGAILAGSLDFEGDSGPATGHCSLTGKQCDPNGPNTCIPIDSQEPNVCIPDDNGGGDGGGAAFLEISNSTFVKNATTTPDATLTDPPTPVGMSSGVAGAVLGGVLSTVHITDTTFSKNASIVGGAFLGLANQEVTIARSTFNDNVVVHDNFTGDSDGGDVIASGVGGAIAAALSNVKISESAIHHNFASQNSAFPGQFGGGIASICSDFDVSNSSLFGNEAQLGGGIFANYGLLNCSIFLGEIEFGGDDNPFTELLVSRVLDSEMRIGNSTLTENLASEEGGGIHTMIDTSDKVLMQETILGRNGLYDVSGTSGPNCEGAITSLDYNLIGADLTGCSFLAASHDQVADPDLEACDDSDPTPGRQSCLPTLSSPANDRGGPDCTAYDQYGIDRYGVDGHCDVGARERNGEDCGNGIAESPSESCDDGSQCDNGADCTFDPSVCATIGSGACAPRSGDGCDSTCILESCGNSVVDAGEQCDDGNLDNFDACNNACLNTFCGDAITNDGADLAGAEACDDGNADDLDFCRDDCTVPVCGDTTVSIHAGEECEDGVTVLPSGASCVNCRIVPGGGSSGGGFCGDSIIQGGEECDNGASNSDSVADACRTNCQLAHCGDDVLDSGEDCDDGGLYPFDGCTQYCKNNLCGDGIRNIDGPGFEECDDANMNNNDFCYTCFDAHCGDAHVQAVIGEECDNGSLCVGGANDGLACEEAFQCPGGVCTPQDGATCTATCQLKSCGDGVLDDGEECDDHNNITGDGCTSTCQDEECGDGILSLLVGEQCEPPSTGSCDESCHLIPETPPNCGNGVLETGLGEECDDGNTNALDGCNSLCQSEECGDGIVQIALGEQCDDGGTAAGDGCDSDCRLESCGDGTVQSPAEECDDGNTNALDGCNGLCQTEDCGDGVVQAALGEQCDDGGTAAGDGCSATCQNEVAPACGDGILQGGEDCDDDNLVPGDGCSPTCTDEVCGDGIVTAVFGEECDDGGTTDGDGCSSTCKDEIAPDCGDGNLDPGEDCDDHNNITGDGCTSTCETEVCGDGIVSALIGEECDDGGTSDGDGCSEVCKNEVAPRCGDGILQGGEDCDDGNNNALDGCNGLCQDESCGDGFVETALGEDCEPPSVGSCDSACHDIPPALPVCGDGNQDPGEDCDDGNDVNEDGCSNLCHLPRCGDGITQTATEQCDDGNANPNDDCTNACRFATCGDGIINSFGDSNEQCDDGDSNDLDDCRNDCSNPTCGDGTVSIYAGEECDPEDGVDYASFGLICINCELEGGGNTPSPYCGDGNVDSGEECDDGNSVNTDACTNACTDAVCGDDATGPGEECDDGNSVNTDACTNACTSAVCGDGVTYAGFEQCDDGNTLDGDGCDSDCMNETPTEPEGGGVCGNGIIESGETCDNGVANSNEPDRACRTDCSAQRCGDDIVDSELGEECDGNRVDCDPDTCKIDACAAIAADARSVATRDDLANFLKKYDVGLDGHSNVAGFEDCVIIFSAGGQVDVDDITSLADNSSGCSLARTDKTAAASSFPLLALFLAPAGLMGLKRLRGRRVYVRSRSK